MTDDFTSTGVVTGTVAKVYHSCVVCIIIDLHVGLSINVTNFLINCKISNSSKLCLLFVLRRYHKDMTADVKLLTPVIAIVNI